METTAESRELNALFSDAISTGQGLEKVSAAGGTFIQEKIRESSFARRIIPPKQALAEHLQRRTTEDTQYFLDDLEPDSMAMEINMRGEPTKVYSEGDRYEIPFSTISTPRFTKAEDELRSYRMPFTAVIEQNSIKDLQEIEDTAFMRHVRSGLLLATRARMNDLVGRGFVTHGGDDMTAPITNGQNFVGPEDLASYLYTRNVTTVANGGNLTAAPGQPHVYDNTILTTDPRYNPATGLHSNIVMSNETTFTRQLMTDGMKVQSARQLEGTCFLLHKFDWDDTMAWLESEAGLKLTDEITRNGYTYNTVGGKTFLTTTRDNDEILSPGQIYTFTAPEFLGRFLLLEGVKFQVQKDFQFISMQAWETIGIGLGNIRGLGAVLMNGASMVLPNLFQLSDGSDFNVQGEFTLTNNLSNPV